MIRSACLTLVLGLTLSCGAGDDTANARQGPPPVSVEVVTVEPSVLRDRVDLVGQLESDASVIVKPEIAGIIDVIEFLEGEPVKKGDLLVLLRDQEQLAALREAEAKANLAADIFQRTQKLRKQHVSADTELSQARSQYQVTNAAVEIARVELDRTRILAPFDGVVGARLVAPGERVDDDTGLVQIDAIDRLQLVFAVPEIGVSAVRVGLPVTLTVTPYPDERFTGTVFFVAPALDPRNRQLLLKAWIPNPEHKLKPGLFANLKIQIAERENAIVVPETAIMYDQEGTFVWRVVDGALAERTAVELGLRRPGNVEVIAGLSPGDRIVSAGTHKVTQGARVSFEESRATTEASGGDAT